jgi:hypothetical protein
MAFLFMEKGFEMKIKRIAGKPGNLAGLKSALCFYLTIRVLFEN